MPYKRKNRGRSKGRGKKGRSETVHCSNCGRLIPADKAIKKVVWVPTVTGAMAKELEKAGTVIPRKRVIRYYCVSCAIHFGIVKIRARESRKELPEELFYRKYRVK
ncbi:MAG: 30S ribosomal protein S26e [Candidatus Njordarchaeia archaeon]|nr:30S ribosomal protein S26e [Candidatus Korarchaeota archaeon]